VLATVRTRPWIWLLLALLLAPQGVAAGAEQPNGSWRVVSTLREVRYGSQATLLGDGRVLIVGGYSLPKRRYMRSAEVWDPRTLTSKSSGAMAVARAGHTATLLTDGRVLVAGGENGAAEESGTQNTVEVWDPSTNKFSGTGPMHEARREHTAIRLADGRVAIDGGARAGQGLELWSAATGTWEVVPDPDRHQYADSEIAAQAQGGLVEITRSPPAVILARRWPGRGGRLDQVAKLDSPRARRVVLVSDSRVVIVSDDRFGVWNPTDGGLKEERREKIGADAFPCWPSVPLGQDGLMCISAQGNSMRTTTINLRSLASGFAGTATLKTDGPFVLLGDGRLLAVAGKRALLWTPRGWKPAPAK
jgi:hypothetical protein